MATVPKVLIAGVLIKYPMANEMLSCYNLDICTYQNQVSFDVGLLDTKVIPTYLEIVCIPDGKVKNHEPEFPLANICSEVYTEQLRLVTSDIDYVNAQYA